MPVFSLQSTSNLLCREAKAHLIRFGPVSVILVLVSAPTPTWVGGSCPPCHVPSSTLTSALYNLDPTAGGQGLALLSTPGSLAGLAGSMPKSLSLLPTFSFFPLHSEPPASLPTTARPTQTFDLVHPLLASSFSHRRRIHPWTFNILTQASPFQEAWPAAPPTCSPMGHFPPRLLAFLFSFAPATP